MAEMKTYRRNRWPWLVVVVVGLALVTLFAWLFGPALSDGDLNIEAPPAIVEVQPDINLARQPVAAPTDRAGLDPHPAANAVEEVPAAELIRRTRDAPPATLTPEEIAAGRKKLEE